MRKKALQNTAKTEQTIFRDKRTELCLTQRQVAKRAGITIQQYQKFEGGQRSLMTASFAVACSVLKALSIDISDYYDHVKHDDP